MRDDDQQAARVIHCPNCGASNPAGAGYCASCGSRLPDDTTADEETLIDVSSGQPRVLDEEPAGAFGSGRVQGGFTTVRFGQGRVVVSEGNRRTCLLVAVVALLVFCCACWVIWSIPGRLF
ncbi:MAG TPA: zinc-ribbon domain-containing protein [Thermomicrobiales bacterium]|nr:zinc-ribbon domain-containing protein [Thermomicrobiales bacterium]